MKRKLRALRIIATVVLSAGLSFDVAAQDPSPNAIVAVAWSPSGDQIAYVLGSGRVEVIDVASGQTTFTADNQLAEILWAAAAWNPIDGTRLAAGIGTDAHIGNVATGENLFTFQAGAADGIAHTGAGARPEQIFSIDWSPDGTYLVSVSFDGILRIWNTTTGEMTLDSRALQITSIWWAPDGTHLFAGAGLALRIVDPDTGQIQKLGENTVQPGTITSIDLSSDGTRLVDGTVFGQITVWNASSGQVLHYIENPRELIREVKWSPDDTRFASAGWDGAIRVWDAVTGQEVAVFQHEGRMFGVDWDPDGSKLVYGGESGTLEIVEVQASRATGALHP